ncbi:MAG: HD domain-containing phosphohydrolase [Vulcanimicrobiota bacterium]
MEKVAKPRILIVDDEERNLKLISSVMETNGFIHDTAKDGNEALEKTKIFHPDLIFLDILMPGLNGVDTLKKLREDLTTRNVPVVMITGLEDRESKIKSLEAGANDFLTKPFDITELNVRTKNLLKIKEFEDFLKLHNEILEHEVKKKTSQLRETMQELGMSRDKLKDSYLDTIYRLTIVAEYKDEGTASHILRIRHYCKLIATAIGWSDKAVEALSYASHMHDIGKVGIPSEILLKPAKLNFEEFALIKTHTVIGARILHGSSSTFLQVAERIALTHHERWDGSGYPQGLKGEDIPLEGRILILADQYDSLRSVRPYKPPSDHKDVYRVLTEGDGRTMPEHFDPKVLDVFRKNHKEFNEIYEKYKHRCKLPHS